MAVPIATFAGAGSGMESRRGPRASELWKLVGGAGGSAAQDAVAITTRYIKKPVIALGAVSVTSASGQTITLAILTALLAGEVIYVEVVGNPA